MSITTRVRNIEVVDRGDDGAAVSLPRSQEMTASLQSAFPRCRWNKFSRVWEVPGRTAARRVAAWANGCAERLHELEPAAALRHRRQEGRVGDQRVALEARHDVLNKISEC